MQEITCMAFHTLAVAIRISGYSRLVEGVTM